MKKALLIFFVFIYSCNWDILNDKIFKYPAPVLTEVTPKKGQGDRVITIKGKYLMDATVKINNQSTTIIQSDTSQITTKVPFSGELIETWKISVLAKGGNSNTLDFIYGPPAKVLNIDPMKAYSFASAPSTITVSGSGFNEIIKINLLYKGGAFNRVLTLKSQNFNVLVIDIPNGIVPGEYAIQVVTEYGDGISKDFEIIN